MAQIGGIFLFFFFFFFFFFFLRFLQQHGGGGGALTWTLTWTLTWLACHVAVHRWRQRGSRDPLTWPVLGAQLEVRAHAGAIHDWCLRYLGRLHRTFTLRLLGGSTLHLTVDPDNLHHILASAFHNYPKGERAHELLHDFLGDGIFNSDGAAWKRHRKLASMEFSSRKLRDFSTIAFRRDAVRLMCRIDDAVAAQQPFDLQDLFMRMTMDSICKVGFGLDIGSLSPSLPDVPFGRAFDAVNEAVYARVMNPFWKLQRALGVGREKAVLDNMKLLNAFTSATIQKRRAEMAMAKESKDVEARGDLLSRFMGYGVVDDPGYGGAAAARYTDKELTDAVLNFMIAGRDTTAVTLSWFIYCVCQHPEVEQKILEEIRRVLGLDDQLHELRQSHFDDVAGRLTYDALGRMHYLHAALTETLRLYPAVPRDGKTVLNDDVLPDGTRVKKGDQVSYVPYCMGRMEFLWGADALIYNPDRWLNEDGRFQPQSPYKFSAFQAGARICLGKDSAYLQMKLTASLLLLFFKLRIVRGHPVHYRVMMVMAMANGLLVNASYRY